MKFLVRSIKLPLRVKIIKKHTTKIFLILLFFLEILYRKIWRLFIKKIFFKKNLNTNKITFQKNLFKEINASALNSSTFGNKVQGKDSVDTEKTKGNIFAKEREGLQFGLVELHKQIIFCDIEDKIRDFA